MIKNVLESTENRRFYEQGSGVTKIVYNHIKRAEIKETALQKTKNIFLLLFIRTLFYNILILLFLVLIIVHIYK